MNKKLNVFFLSCAMLFAAAACKKHSDHSMAPKDAEVFIISPDDGQTLRNPVVVKFGITGMEVAPAGTDKPHSGHHHLMIDVDELPDLSMAIPADDNHRHFGKGQTETSLELAPGEHTLQLILGDKNHVPHDPPVISKKIRITVK